MATKTPLKNGMLQIDWDNGRRTFRQVIDAGPDPVTGKRRQVSVTRDTQTEVRREVNRIRAERDRGTLVVPDKRFTVGEAVDRWLAGRRNIAEATVRNYTMAARRLRRSFGAVPVTALTRDHVDRMINAMLSGEARSIGTPGQPLSASAVRVTVGVLSSTLDDLIKEGKATTNVAKLVELPRLPEREDRAWSIDETRRFLHQVRGDRLYALYLASLHGLRRGELLNVRWGDVDLEASTLRITKSKTRAGRRTLPLTPVLADALRAHRRQLAEERLRAGECYSPTDLLAVDEVGRPIIERIYSATWKKACAAAGVPVVTLHSARHTASTLLRSLNVDPWLVSRWLGHTDPRLTLQVYTDLPKVDDLRDAGEAFSRLLDPPNGLSAASM
jgi:integrase